MKKTLLAVGMTVVLLMAAKAQATLIDQGNGLVYDDVNQISWTQDANLSGLASNYIAQVAWADGLSLAGYDDFRLATIDELASLYAQLPGAAGSNKTGAQSLFVDIQDNYWSGTSFSATQAWGYRFSVGQADVGSQRHKYYGWAVVPDSPTLIPEPSSVVVLGLGLLGLRVVRRWRRDD